VNRKLQGDQGRLQVVEEGKGQPTILFVHSSAGNVTHWAHQMEALRSSHRVVAVDLRGHGGSDDPRNGDFSVEGLSSDIASVIDRLNLGSCVLVGHSVGALAALHCAARHPDQVEGLFLLDPANDARHLTAEEQQGLALALQQEYRQTSEAYWRTLIGEDEQVGARLMDDLRAASPLTFQQELGALFGYDPLPDLDRFRNPLFCLAARSTQSPSSLQVLRPALPHQVVSGSGHWIQLEHPALVTGAIQRFLNQLASDEWRED